MVIWLRNRQAEGPAAGPGVGVDGDVVRVADFTQLVGIDAGYAAMQSQCDAALQAARDEAQSILDAARSQADTLVANAEEQYASAASRGYAEGFAQGLADWHDQAIRTHAEAQTLDARQRDRLAGLVALAVEQVVASEDPKALFMRAASTVEAIVADGSPVHVVVHPSGLEAARAAFEEIALRWRDAGRAVRLVVRADPALGEGACVCETDLGAVDVSLPIQLAAMRAALSRAVQSIADGETDGVAANVEQTTVTEDVQEGFVDCEAEGDVDVGIEVDVDVVDEYPVEQMA
jgi:type III secretion protein L